MLPPSALFTVDSFPLGLLWLCPQILRPDWKGFPMANPLAYWASSSVMKEKSLITLTPGVNVIKLFTVVICDFS